jgi:hypothetical protein
MPTISRGIIKSYDAVANRAAVQLAGSLAVWLDALPVSAAIEPPEVVAGRECGVLFFTDDNPDDACVISVHNAVPLGANRLRDADADTSVEVEASPDEDKIRLTVFGTLRALIQSASPHLDLTGDQRITGYLSVGADGVTPQTGWGIRIATTLGGSTTIDGINNVVQTDGSGVVRGVTGSAVVGVASSSPISYVRGLEFRSQHSGSGTVTDHVCIQTYLQGVGPAINRIGYSNVIAGVTATPTLQAAYYALLSVGQTITTPHYYGYLSDANFTRTTVTDLYHYALRDAVTAFGAVLTTVYGYYSPNLIKGTNKLPFYDGGIGGNKNDTSGNRFRSNTQFGATAGQFGTGDGVVSIAPATTNPSTNPATAVILYVDAADGKLKARGSAGTVTVLAVP